MSPAGALPKQVCGRYLRRASYASGMSAASWRVACCKVGASSGPSRLGIFRPVGFTERCGARTAVNNDESRRKDQTSHASSHIITIVLKMARSNHCISCSTESKGSTLFTDLRCRSDGPHRIHKVDGSHVDMTGVNLQLLRACVNLGVLPA